MTDKQLLKIVIGFRRGILNRKSPTDHCFMVCSPLQSFLKGLQFDCDLIEVGVMKQNKLHNHYFLQLKDGRILDPTASQFTDPTGQKMPDIYLGERPAWYQKLRNSKHSEAIKPKKRKTA